MDYRNVLSAKFSDRRKANPRYSLRAFARDLAISPSRLSEVISGKGELSLARGRVVAKKLGLTSIESRDFLDLIDAASAFNASHRQAILNRIQKRRRTQFEIKLTAEKFDGIARWECLAIWSFLGLPACDGECETIALQLKMNVIEVYESLVQLERAGLVKRVSGKWKVTTKEFSTGDGPASEAIRSYHRRLSELGRKSIDGLPMNQRHLDSLVFPLKQANFSEIQQKIADFVFSLSTEYSDPSDGDSIYGLSLQFFNIWSQRGEH